MLRLQVAIAKCDLEIAKLVLAQRQRFFELLKQINVAFAAKGMQCFQPALMEVYENAVSAQQTQVYCAQNGVAEAELQLRGGMVIAMPKNVGDAEKSLAVANVNVIAAQMMETNARKALDRALQLKRGSFDVEKIMDDANTAHAVAQLVLDQALLQQKLAQLKLYFVEAQQP